MIKIIILKRKERIIFQSIYLLSVRGLLGGLKTCQNVTLLNLYFDFLDPLKFNNDEKYPHGNSRTQIMQVLVADFKKKYAFIKINRSTTQF